MSAEDVRMSVDKHCQEASYQRMSGCQLMKDVSIKQGCTLRLKRIELKLKSSLVGEHRVTPKNG